MIDVCIRLNINSKLVPKISSKICIRTLYLFNFNYYISFLDLKSRGRRRENKTMRDRKNIPVLDTDWFNSTKPANARTEPKRSPNRNSNFVWISHMSDKNSDTLRYFWACISRKPVQSRTKQNVIIYYLIF